MKWLDRRLIQNPLCVGLCLSEKKFRKEMKRLGVNDPPEFVISGKDATAHFFTKGDEQSVIVTLGETKGRTKEEVYALLVHEAVHIWQSVRDSMGEKFPSMEFEAYSIQQISLELMAAYKELRK